MSDERDTILEMVEDTGCSTADSTRVAPSQPAARDSRYWQYPLWAGMAILIPSIAAVTAAYQNQRVSLGTWLCGWVPLTLGLTLATLAVWARTAPWVHIRIKDRNDRLSLHLPLPLGLTAAVLRVVRPYVPKLRETAVDEAILALHEGLNGGEDIVIDVRDDEQGERVDIDFGGKS